jgi:RNA polymerase sigma factor (sigma-70 family)
MIHKSWTDYNVSRKKNKLPTLEDDRWLADKYNNGVDRDANKAAEQILNLYGNLAHSIAIKCKGRGVELEDLLQSAKMGLLYSLTKYNADKSKLSTYATPWIWQYCLRTIENTGRTIRLPNHIHEALIQIIRVGIDLDYEVLIKMIDLPPTRIQAALDGYKTLTMSLDDITDVYEDKNMDRVILDSMMDSVLLLFDRDPLSANVIKDYCGLGDEDEMMDVGLLSAKYNKSINDMTDILNTALNVIRDSGLLDGETIEKNG